MPIPIVAVVAFDHFSPFHCSVPCLIFGDILPGQPLFELRLCAGDDKASSHSSQGFSIQAPHGLKVLAEADIIVIPFWRDPAERPAQPLLDALVAAYGRGAQVVGLCLGTYVLAYAGLLNGRKASTHWEYEQDFLRRFPCVRLDTNALYVDDGGHSCRTGLLPLSGTPAPWQCHRQPGGTTAGDPAPPGRWPGPVHPAAGLRLYPGCQDEPAARSLASPPAGAAYPRQPGGPQPDESAHFYPPLSSGHRPLRRRVAADRAAQVLPGAAGSQHPPHRTHRRTGGFQDSHLTAPTFSGPLRGFAERMAAVFSWQPGVSLSPHPVPARPNMAP